ncbi:MAG: DUF2180 family protein [Armatimonadetes bacterium]|nr:DUF2180 family protein [Armatimonadota bacterium]
MNCYECHPGVETAVAVCHLCGKGLCREHCVRQERKVHEHIPSGMTSQVRPRERTLPRMVCGECDAAVGTSDAAGKADVSASETRRSRRE